MASATGRRAVASAALMVLAITAVLLSTDSHPAGFVTESDTELVGSLPKAEQEAAQEFVEDSSFWSAVQDAKTELKGPEQELAEAAASEEKETPPSKQPIIQVPRSELSIAKDVAKQAATDEAKADAACRAAKEKARDSSAASSKAKRDAAAAEVQKICQKLRNVVTTEVANDVDELAGKAAKAEVKDEEKESDTDTSAKEEKKLFAQSLGKDVEVTGDDANESAKNQAKAEELQRMAKKTLVKDKDKVEASCQKALKLAHSKEGEAHFGKEPVKKAHEYCDKIRKVLVQEKQLVSRSVKQTAETGDVKATDSTVVEQVTAEDAANELAQTKQVAEKACKEAKAKASADGRPEIMAKASELCKKVSQVVKQEEEQAAGITGAVPTVSEDATAVPQEGSPASVIAELKAQAQAACDSAKSQAAAVPDGPDRETAKSMAEQMCQQVKMQVSQRIAKLEADTDVEAETQESAVAAPNEDAMDTQVGKVMNRLKEKATQACQEAKEKASSGDMSQDDAATLCSRVKELVKQEEAKASDMQAKISASTTPKPAPETATEDDGTTMGERPAAVIAKAKAAAAQACEQAKAKAKLIQGKDAADAQRVAQQMCDQVKAEVEEGIRKLKAQAAQNAVVDADDYGDDKVKADIEKAQAKANGGGSNDASRLKQTLRKVAKAAQQRIGPVKTPKPGAVGAMPAEVANKIAAEAAKAQHAEELNMAKADELCKLAKEKVRDSAGQSEAEERARGVEKAIKFCQSTQSAAEQQAENDDEVFAKIAHDEAKQYGLKVVKVGHGPAEAPAEEVEAETHLFKKSIGKEADDMTTKTGLEDAIHEDDKQELKKQIGKAKEKVNAHIKEMKDLVNKKCEEAKEKIKHMAGKDKADDRAAKLDKAIQYCKNAHRVVKKEEKVDHKLLKKLEAKEEKAMEHDSAQADSDYREDHPEDKDAAAAKVAYDRALKKDTNKGSGSEGEGTSESESDPEGYMAQTQAAMKAKAAAMCKQMKDKVDAMQHPPEGATQKAKEFCMKVKGLISKQLAMDKAALAKAQKKPTEKDALSAERAEALRKETEATERAKALRQKEDAHIQEEKKAIRAKAEEKLQDLNDKRMRALAKKQIAARKRRAERAKGFRRKAALQTPEDKAQIQKTLKQKRPAGQVNTRGILDNLKAMRHNLATVDTVLASFERSSLGLPWRKKP